MPIIRLATALAVVALLSACTGYEVKELPPSTKPHFDFPSI